MRSLQHVDERGEEDLQRPRQDHQRQQRGHVRIEFAALGEQHRERPPDEPDRRALAQVQQTEEQAARARRAARRALRSGRRKLHRYQLVLATTSTLKVSEFIRALDVCIY